MGLIISVFAGGARATMRTAERDCVSKTFSLPVREENRTGELCARARVKAAAAASRERSIVFNAQQQKLQTYCEMHHLYILEMAAWGLQ